MKRRWITTLGIVLILAAQLSCRGPGSSKPPHYGGFLKDGSRLIEMEQYNGGPVDFNDRGIPEAPDSHPSIVLWYEEANTSNLRLRQGIGVGMPIPYDVTPQEEGILEIRPEDPLDPGVYCLVQGDPLKSPIEIPYWCFRIGEYAQSSAKGAASGSDKSVVDCLAVRGRIEAGNHSDLVPGANLWGCNLSKLNMVEVDLSDADLSNADLSSADLTKAKLVGANLSGANLSGTYLVDADLRNANLSGASGLRCDGESLAESLWTADADFTGANVQDAVLAVGGDVWSPDNVHLISATALWRGAKIAFRDTTQDLRVTSLEAPDLNSDDDFEDVAVSPDGNYLAVVATDFIRRVVYVIDISTGNVTAAKGDEEQSFYTVAWHPDGRRLACGGRDSVLIWDVETGADLATLDDEVRDSAEPAMLWSPDGNLLATVGKDKAVRVWNIDTGDTVSLFRHSDCDSVGSITWSPDGSRLVSADYRVARVWDVQNGSVLNTIEVDRASSVAWSPSGEVIAIGSSWGSIGLYDPQGDSVLELQARFSRLHGVYVVWNRDGTRLMGDGTIWPVAVLLDR